MAARIVAIQELVNVVRDRVLDPKRASARLAKIARDKRAEVEAKQGRHPTEVRVDGKAGLSEDAVNPSGTIVYLIHPFAQFVDELWAALRQESPVGPSKAGPGYRSLHFRDQWHILVNDQPAPEGSWNGRQPKPGETWTFVNTMPYARRLAWGWSVQAPPLWIEEIAKRFERQYGNLFGGATLRGGNLKGFQYAFIIPPADIMPPEDHQFSERARRYDRHLRYPAIVVRVPGNALTS